MSDSKVSVNQVKGKQQTSYLVNPPKVCYHCGGPHLATTCPFVHETCRACDKTAILPECVKANAQSMVQVPEDPVAQELILEIEHIFSKFTTRFQIHLLGQPATHPVQQLLKYVYTMFPVSRDPNRSPCPL